MVAESPVKETGENLACRPAVRVIVDNDHCDVGVRLGKRAAHRRLQKFILPVKGHYYGNKRLSHRSNQWVCRVLDIIGSEPAAPIKTG